jgi:hypothetical protein
MARSVYIYIPMCVPSPARPSTVRRRRGPRACATGGAERRTGRPGSGTPRRPRGPRLATPTVQGSAREYRRAACAKAIRSRSDTCRSTGTTPITDCSLTLLPLPGAWSRLARFACPELEPKRARTTARKRGFGQGVSSPGRVFTMHGTSPCFPLAWPSGLRGAWASQRASAPRPAARPPSSSRSWRAQRASSARP